MKKSIMFAVAILSSVLIAGCASAPTHYNMTGVWQYSFEETGKSGIQTGSMTIRQNAYAISGKSSDAFGEFDLTGSLSENSPKFMIAGKRNDYKRNFSLSGTLSSPDKFEGTYTTDQNTAVTMNGKRISAE